MALGPAYPAPGGGGGGGGGTSPTFESLIFAEDFTIQVNTLGLDSPQKVLFGAPQVSPGGKVEVAADGLITFHTKESILVTISLLIGNSVTIFLTDPWVVTHCELNGVAYNSSNFTNKDTNDFKVQMYTSFILNSVPGDEFQVFQSLDSQTPLPFLGGLISHAVSSTLSSKGVPDVPSAVISMDCLTHG
jgi:hypothetical protein